MKDLILGKTLKQGHKGKKVKLFQEWLCIHGFHLAIDGDFGPATDYAVRQFQKKKKIAVDGIIGEETFKLMVEPMTRVLAPIEAGGRTPGQMLVAYARQHLKQHPVEIGGQNKGPWVRLYMNGNEGPAWPWCAGFVSFLLKQTYQRLGKALPLQTTFSCDILVAQAKEKGRFLDERTIEFKNVIKPGAIFLNRRTRTDWVHTGIVVRAEDEIFHTIEGNTNDEGSREGYEVCQRIRGYKKKDFIII
ncbi:peptidoglycan-binding protein [Thermodesulfobacteriota bacterium]